MKTWGDLLSAMLRAIDERDEETGEDLVELMQREAARSGELGQEASALFYEGMFADAIGQLARAEACFAEVVEIDRRLHGPMHTSVADALNSLALVRERMGKLELRAEASAECAAIYEAVGSPHRCSAFVRAGDAMLRVGRDAEAKDLLERALQHPATPDAPWRKYAGVLLHRVHLRHERYRECLGALARASREPMAGDRQSREAQARIFCDIGHVSVVFGLGAQSAAAYRSALVLSENDALRAEAQRGLDELGASFEAPLDALRVVHVDREQRRAHVAHPERGLFVALDPPPVEIGDAVELEADESPTRIRAVLRP